MTPQEPAENKKGKNLVAAEPPGIAARGNGRPVYFFVKRLRLAWRFHVLPWNVPTNVVRYIGLRKPTEADLQRGEELAKEHGWK